MQQYHLVGFLSELIKYTGLFFFTQQKKRKNNMFFNKYNFPNYVNTRKEILQK
jgi:hypothetical protein